MLASLLLAGIILFVHFRTIAGKSAKTGIGSNPDLNQPVVSTTGFHPQFSPATARNSLAAQTEETDPEKIALTIRSLSEAEVTAWLARLSNAELNGNTGRLLLRRWVELNPSVAADWAAHVNDSDISKELVDLAAIAWSEKDMTSAMNWVQSLATGDAKNQALADLGYEMARTEPLNAIQLAAQLPASESSDNLLVHTLTQYAAVNPSQSQQLALALPVGPLRDQAIANVATVQARQDGAAAARFAVENLPAGGELDRAVIGIVQLWGQGDLTDTVAWVMSFPNSPLRDQAGQILTQFSKP